MLEWCPWLCMFACVCVRAFVYFYPFLELTQTHMHTHALIRTQTHA